MAVVHPGPAGIPERPSHLRRTAGRANGGPELEDLSFLPAERGDRPVATDSGGTPRAGGHGCQVPPSVRRLCLLRRPALPLARGRRRTGCGGRAARVAERRMDQRPSLRPGGAGAGTSPSFGNRACRYRGGGRLGHGVLERGAHLRPGLPARGGRRRPALPQRTGAPGARRLRLRSACAQRVR